MNNAYAMSLNQEASYRNQAYMITGGFTVLAILIMFLLKWKTPVPDLLVADSGIEVEMNLPPDPPLPPETGDDGGGGGGNPVQASGPAGVANYAPPSAGEDSRDVEENDDKAAPEISKPVVVKPKAVAVTNTTAPKEEPKPVVETPAPRVPKAVLGKTTTGTGRGGGAEDYDRPGGSGNGSGVGNGNGNGGGKGNGNGGGNGTGTGSGTGPRVTNGDRKVVRSYSFEDNLDKATIYANVNVAPDGTGKFISIAKGSSNSGAAYKNAIVRYLQNIRFDKADHESMVTVRFNFEVQ